MDSRVRKLNDAPLRPGARYVLYWAQMNRRVDSNHGLEFAVALANQQNVPVLFYEGLTCDYPYASDRFHTFLLEGVPDTARALKKRGIGYLFYLRRRRRDPNDVLYRLAQHAAAIVTDDYPAFVARSFNAALPAKMDIPYFAVDSSCVVPMSRLEKREYAAYTIRPRIHKLLRECLRAAPALPVLRRWQDGGSPLHTEVTGVNIAGLVASCEIDHAVTPSLSFRGGSVEAERHLRRFLDERLGRYGRDRNEPSKHATSDQSPYLHFGHMSALRLALEARRHAEEHRLIADEFLEELIVRRELAFNYARFTKQPASLDNLPDWARATLRKHAADERPVSFTRDQFERAETDDPLWNATQKELLLRGKIHGYYRMYWGKKIIEWSPTHEDALDTMVYLHDRYALDGRDPNTYSNILWCFGLHDRPWGERPIFGSVRYMAASGMKRKTDVEAYRKEIAFLERTGQDPFV